MTDWRLPWKVVHDAGNVLSIQDADGKEMCSLYSDTVVTPEMWKRAKFILRAVLRAQGTERGA